MQPFIHLNGNCGRSKVEYQVPPMMSQLAWVIFLKLKSLIWSLEYETISILCSQWDHVHNLGRKGSMVILSFPHYWSNNIIVSVCSLPTETLEIILHWLHYSFNIPYSCCVAVKKRRPSKEEEPFGDLLLMKHVGWIHEAQSHFFGKGAHENSVFIPLTKVIF